MVNRKLIPMVGKKFGKLTVIKLDHVHPNGTDKYWLCQCDCGNTHIGSGANLRYGSVKSCGCLLKKCTSDNFKRYGPLYSIWSSMKSRCKNPKRYGYSYYGGSGIKVVTEWECNFKSFEAWALSHGYKPGLTIDRINPDGDYCPENCQFITRQENTSKRRRRTKAQIALDNSIQKGDSHEIVQQIHFQISKVV